MLEFLTKKIQRTGRESGRGKTEALKGNDGGENGFLNRFFDYMEKVNKQLLKISYHFSDFWNSYLKFAVFPYIHILYMF